MEKAKGNFDLLLKMKQGKLEKKVEEPEKEEFKEDLSKLTNKVLRKMLEDRGLPVYGTKQELIKRLKAGE